MSLAVRHVADDAVGGRVLGGDAVDGVAGARDEGDACAAGEQLADERQAQPGGAAGHRDAEADEDVARDVRSRALTDSRRGGRRRFLRLTWSLSLQSSRSQGHAGILQVKVNLKSSGAVCHARGMSDLLTITRGLPPQRRRRLGAALLRGSGLIASERAGSGHRRYPRAVLRRIAFIVFAQKIGLSLTEVGAELARLPRNRVPERADWAQAVGRLDAAHRRTHRRARAPARRRSRSASAAAACRCSTAGSPTRRTAPAAPGRVRAIWIGSTRARRPRDPA